MAPNLSSITMPSKQRPNIIIIETDQQRHDSIAALGYPHMITPNLDRLQRQSLSLTHSFCCGATCVASRAAFYTGMHAHNTGVYSFDPWTHVKTWLHNFRDAGYHLSAIGKVHFSPDFSWQGPFHERVIAENFPMWEPWDDYSNYLKKHQQPHPLKELTKDGRWNDKFASDAFPLEEKYHVDAFVGHSACEWIQAYQQNDPFLLHVGFVGPHDPFDPPQRCLDRYQDRSIPSPITSGDDFEQRPPQYRRFMEPFYQASKDRKPPAYGASHIYLKDKSEEDILRWRRHYYAKITFIDEQIGQLLKSLEERGFLENSIIVFTSDHGENLGDHQLIYKWLLTEQVTRVPCMVRLPERHRDGDIDNELFSQIDIGPTLLDYADIEIPRYLDGRSQRARLSAGERDNIPERVYCRDNYMTLVRTKDRKLIHYAGQDYGEYYNLERDPDEAVNLFEHPEYAEEIRTLTLEFLEEQAASSYTGSPERAGHDSNKIRNWPAYFPQDPYLLFGQAKQ